MNRVTIVVGLGLLLAAAGIQAQETASDSSLIHEASR